MKKDLKKLFDGRSFSFAGLVRTTDSNMVVRLFEGKKLHDIEFFNVKETVCNVQESASLSEFSLSSDNPYLWDYGEWSSIFGNAPLPDVPKFFYDFNQLVRDTLSVGRDPLNYLNTKGTILEWKNFVYSRAYSLLTAPTQVVEATRDLLDIQAAEYAVLKDPEIEEVTGLSLLQISHEGNVLLKVVFEDLKITS